MEISFTPFNIPEQPYFEYPFQELKYILKKFEFSPYDQRLKYELKYTIDMFIEKTKHIYNVHSDENRFFDIRVIHKDSGAIKITCSNIFTACILYGNYVPIGAISEHMNKENKITFLSGDYIEYSTEAEEYMYNKVIKFNKKKP